MLQEGRDDRQTALKRQTSAFDLTLGIRLAYTLARMQSHENLVSSYIAQADELERVLSAAPPETILRNPGENRWSILQVVGHLADAELLASVRIRRIITQDRTRLWGYQQEVWADRLGYQRRKLQTVLSRFALLRRENGELLADQSDGVWEQTAEHDLYGVLSLRQWIEDYLDHTAKHLNQIRELIGSQNQ